MKHVLCGSIGVALVSLILHGHRLAGLRSQHSDLSNSTDSSAAAPTTTKDDKSTNAELNTELVQLATADTPIISSWEAPPSLFRISTVQLPDQGEYYRQVVLENLRNYEPDWMRTNLKVIWIAETMSFRGVDAFGTQDGVDTLWLAVSNPVSRWRRESYLQVALHHELGCLLFLRLGGKFPRGEWEKCLPPGFKYGGDPVIAILNGQGSTLTDASLAATGFLSAYAQSSLEKDFAIIHEHMMINPYATRALSKRSPQLAAKIAIWERVMKSERVLRHD